ncbi:MAG: pyridoxal phosphate-dependent aminotransferase [Thermoprotei archaeon]|nr:pyridoxal phosphate-dependent aminotransferase [Thermoprotei archaeon]
MPTKPPVLNLRRKILEMKPEAAFDYLVLAKIVEKEGKDVISFGIGQPDFDTPENIKEAAKKALDEGFTGYTAAIGIDELREAIADYTNERYGTDVKHEEVGVTVGAKGAIAFSILAYIKGGDEVIIPDPAYPVYEELVKFAGGKPVHVPLDPEKGYSLSAEELEKYVTPNTKMIIINNPHNPTGGLIEEKELEGILELAKRKRIIVLADEIYDHFIYEGKFKSALQDTEWRDFVLYVNGASKTFSMTGWRIGWLIAHRKVIEKLKDFAVNTTSNPTSIAQKATVEALRGPKDEVNKMINEFRERRDILVRELRKVPGVKVIVPKGTFYMFPSFERIVNEAGISTEEFVLKLLYTKGVVILPGSAFSSNSRWFKYVRFAFTIKKERIIEGIRKLREFVDELLEEKGIVPI